MSAAVAAAVQELPGFTAGQEYERELIVALIRGRGISALKMVKRSLLTEEDAQRLDRWLDALAGDVEAGLHDMDRAE